MEIGTWADVVAAVGGLAGATVSIFALRTALAANKTAERTREDAREQSGQINSREETRQKAAVARQLQAWWVVWPSAQGNRFGILVTNAGEGATVFRDVRIQSIGNMNARGSHGQITFTSLPPGAYVIPSNGAGAQSPWGAPEAMEPGIRYEPLVRAQRYAVTKISFVDPTRVGWVWTPEQGLVELAAAAPST